jgi:sugar lactone lactonase YvrE
MTLLTPNFTGKSVFPLKIIVFAYLIIACLFNPASNVLAQSTPRERTAVYPLDGVRLDNGNVYIVDRNLPGVWQRSGDALSVFVQGNRSFRKPLNAVRCIAAGRDGELYVGDSATREIYRIASDGTTQPLTNGLIGVPVDLAVSAEGTLYVADLERRAVWSWNPGKDEKPEVLYPKANARGLTVDNKDRLWILSQNAEQLVRYDKDGMATTIVSSRVFEFAHNVIVDDDDTAWVSDGYAKAIWKVPNGGPPIKQISSELLQNPVGLFRNEDKIAIVDPHAMTVFQATREGAVEVWFKIEKPAQ